MLLFFLIFLTLSNVNSQEIDNLAKILAVDSGSDRPPSAAEFLDHYRSLNPVAFLVDDTALSKKSARNFISDLKNYPGFNTNCLFYIFNSTASSEKTEISLQNLEKKLDSLTINQLGQSKDLGSAFFLAVLNSAKDLPEGSAVVVFTARPANDEYMSQYVKFIFDKAIRVYVIWGGFYPTNGKEEKLFRELCQRSGGAFLIDSHRSLSALNLNEFLNKERKMNISILTARWNVVGASTLKIPVDSSTAGFHVSLNHVKTGSLTSPNGYKIDIFNDEQVAKYSSQSFSIRNEEKLDLHISTESAWTRDVGTWILNLNGGAAYNITVFVFSPLTTDAYIVNAANNNTTQRGKVVKLSIKGSFFAIDKISLVDQNGNDLGAVPASELAQYETEDIDEQSITKDIHIDTSTTNQNLFAVVKGKDSNGNIFERTSYVYRDKDIFPRPPLTIDVALGSELITNYGKYPRIYFEITNNGRKPTFVKFAVRDQNYLLFDLSPYGKMLGPDETTVVTVTLRTFNGATNDELIFFAYGAETVERKVLIDIRSTQPVDYDRREPDLDYKYTGDCTDTIFSNCESGSWTIEVKAKDTGSGLLQLTSIPKGLYFPYGFTAGSKEEITGYYSDTCCNPDIQLIAIDRANNRRVRYPNAYLTIWSPGAIAALVLGIIFFILLIVLIVWLIRKCIGKRDTFYLPRYRGSGRI